MLCKETGRSPGSLWSSHSWYKGPSRYSGSPGTHLALPLGFISKQCNYMYNLQVEYVPAQVLALASRTLSLVFFCHGCTGPPCSVR